MSSRGPVVLRLIDFYQRAVEGRPSPCRFTPSCSSYARDAYVIHGRWRGSWLTVRRLARCRPFGPSGFDPVPEPRSPRAPEHHRDRPAGAVCTVGTGGTVGSAALHEGSMTP